MSVLFDKWGLLQVAHVLVLVVWLGGGYALLAYAKVVMNKPNISTACSLVSLVCSPIITKEGAFHIGQFQSQAILQVMLLALCGSVVSNAVCFLVWPKSATSKLHLRKVLIRLPDAIRTDLNRTLNSFSTLLDMLTKTFLLDDITTHPEDLKKAIDSHQSSFTTLKASLSQAKYEFFDSRMAGTTRAYDQAVASMTRLAQGLTGMRAGCTLQWELIMAKEEGKLGPAAKGKEGSDTRGDQGAERQHLLDEAVVLDMFRERVGPSLRQLTCPFPLVSRSIADDGHVSVQHTSKEVLALLRTSFVQTKAGSPTRKALQHGDDLEADALPAESLLRLRSELEQSLLMFKREHSRAVKILYRSLPSQTIYGVDDLDFVDPFADFNRRTKTASGEGPNENLFRIYHFCFNYEEWAAELLHLVGVFIELRTTEELVERQSIEREKRFGTLAGIARLLRLNAGAAHHGPSTRPRIDASIRHQFARAMSNPRSKRRSIFPEIVDGALSSHLADSAGLSLVSRIKHTFWRFGWYLRQPNIRFAVKTGAGVAVLSSAAFIPSLRPIWLEWKGEWALISYMVIMAPSTGSTNFLALMRVFGTALGAAVAVGFYLSFPENPYVLPLLGALFSAPCFFVAITRPQYAPSSRFVLLTFNLTCLYCFNLREIDTHVVSIAFHRFVAVTVGVLYGLLANTYVWPFEARRELRKGLSECGMLVAVCETISAADALSRRRFFINASYLYEQIIRVYSAPPPSLAQAYSIPRSASEDADESTSLLGRQAQMELERAAEDFVAMELELQLTLIRVSGLLAATPHEPRLKGPFPVAEYQKVLSSCQTLLDLLTAVARMTHREAWFAAVRRDFVIPVNKERREMVRPSRLLAMLPSRLSLTRARRPQVGNIVLYFSILSSAVSLKSPLPAYLPPAAEARQRLVAKLQGLEVVKRRLVRGGSESLLYYAYIIVIKDVIAQLDELGRSFQQLFGIIGTGLSFFALD
ncbi:SPOSA6832_04576, partial [Sporobolomyces salmonicolor]